MLFRTSNGSIKEINIFDCNNDVIYYKKVMELKKDFLKNREAGEGKGVKKDNNTLTFFLQKSSK
jgi:hypothetical protein